MITDREREVLFDIAASDEAIRSTFVEHREELRWLADFLTGSDEVAEACVVDVYRLAQKSWELEDWLPVSPAFAIICAALEIQRKRIAELSNVYEGRMCLHPTHGQLAPESLEFIVGKSEVIRSRLDTLSRFVLVICGIEKSSYLEASQWLGISPIAVESALCAAVESLEVIECEIRFECDASPAAWN
jgi:hypothetical protein